MLIKFNWRGLIWKTISLLHQFPRCTKSYSKQLPSQNTCHARHLPAYRHNKGGPAVSTDPHSAYSHPISVVRDRKETHPVCNTAMFKLRILNSQCQIKDASEVCVACDQNAYADHPCWMNKRLHCHKNLTNYNSTKWCKGSHSVKLLKKITKRWRILPKSELTI